MASKKATEVATAVKKATTDVAVVPESAGALSTYTAEELAAIVATDDFDNMGRADVAIPFLKVLQALSPECTPGDGNYNPDARPGMIIHTITKELFTSVNVTPVVYKRSYLEWVPRNKGGGFRGEYPTDTHEKVYQKLRDPSTGKASLENGNDLIETLAFFCLLNRDDGTDEPVLISMSSTQTGTGRQWNQRQQAYRPPGAPARPYKRCIARYNLGTDMKRNDKGAWYVWGIRNAQTNPPDTINMALEFERQIKGGSVIVDHEGMGSDIPATTGSDM